MKKLLIVLLISFPTATTFAYPYSQSTDQTRFSIFAEYSAHKGKFENDIDADLDGGAVGFSTVPNRHGFWGKFEALQNNEYSADYYELSTGGQINFYNANNIYLIGTAGLGFGWSDVEDFDNSQFVTLPIGLEAGYHFSPNFSLYGGVGYKWAWDASSKTTCNDGSTSNSTESGTCSWHGGVDHYNNTIGDFDGVTYKAGARYNF